MKHLTNRDFIRLIDEVERQGGVHVPERCIVEEIDDLAMKKLPPALSSGCEEDALFDVAFDPYAAVKVNEPILVDDPDPDAPAGRKKAERDDYDNIVYRTVTHAAPVPAGHEGTLHLMRACANDDLMALWPRFAHVITDSDPSR